MKIFNFTFALLITSLFSIVNINAQYCDLQGDDSSSEWIQAVTVGTFTNNTGNNSGYVYYSNNQNLDLQKGNSYQVNLSPGYSGNSYTEYWRIWIDLNQDGDFNDANELVFDDVEGQQGTETGNIAIPNNSTTKTGATRMRIAMKWVGTLNDGTDDTAAPNDCGSFNFGEVEDYSINITNSSSTNNYCTSSGDSSADEWIQAVSIGSYNYNSENNNGYADFTNFNSAIINLENNTSYSIKLTPGYSGEDYSEYWRIWIDLNNDNDFNDANELIYDAGGGNTGVVNANINIPNVQVTNSTMRVSMKWVGTLDDGDDTNPPNSCGIFNFGEVEDYKINITNNTNTIAPVANFTSNITTGPAPLTVNFTDGSSNVPTSWTWTFEGGNPESSTQQNPTVVYNQPGTYRVSLSATNSAGNDYKTVDNYITVTEGAQVPNTDFTANVTSGTTPLTVNFSDNSTNNPTNWSWSFPGGNPSSSTQQNPTVVYNNAGTYSVTLTSSNNAGANVETKNSFITVTDVAIVPMALFSSNITSGQTPMTVQFVDQSTNFPTSWNWIFDGGNPSTSTLQNPSVVYTQAGTYAVTLQVSNGAGSNMITQQGYITVGAPTLAPVVNFTSDVVSGAAPLQVQFSDISLNSPTIWSWTFEGGSPATSTLQNPTVIYNNPGIYTVTLTASNSIGADVKTEQSYIQVLERLPEPNVSFTASIYSGPAPLSVTFFDESTNNPTSWQWEFPGASPGSSNEKNPTVTYNNPGVFQVTLTATNATGSTTQTQQEYINIEFPTGIEDIEVNELDLTIYPNPTTDFVNINACLESPVQPQLFLYNTLGQQLQQINLGKQKEISMPLDVTVFPTGLYFIKIVDENGFEMERSFEKL